MRKFLRTLNHIEEYTLGLTLLGLAIFSSFQVFTRYVFNYSFFWFEEFSRYICVFITFLGAGLGVKHGTHFAMTALVERLPFRVQKACTALVYLVSAVFFIVVLYYGAIICRKHFRFENLSAALRIPMYVPYLPIPVFSAVMAVRCLIIAGRGLAEAVSGPKPGSGEEPA